VGKNKLNRWAEMEEFSNVVQPAFDEVFRKDYLLKGNWNTSFFKNEKPIVLELGCGKGEYTLGMAQRFPQKNFLGIDIKGARMWKGAKEAFDNNITNAGFLRTRIEMIESFFAPDEISEIWITFPDPQIKKRRNKKRLSGSRFLNSYKKFLAPGGLVHLKTDSAELYEYTNDLLVFNSIKSNISTDDLYSLDLPDELLSIKTHYEKLFLTEGKKITYTRFNIDSPNIIAELPDEDE
jgi:tRNA (guanine-N7-)-methyltransferase